MSPSSSRTWGWLAVVSAAAVLPWGGALGGSYLADDFFFAEMYRGLALPFSDLVRNVFVINQTPTTFYRPLAFATLAAEVRWWGDTPAWMHVTNVALHVAVTLILFTVARRLLTGPSRNHAAALAACAFALFPRRVEAVAWLSCRPDLLCALFGVTMLWLFVASQARGNGAMRWAALAAWWCALLSKEAAITLPLALPFISVSRAARGPFRERVVELWPWLASGLVFLGLRRAVLGAWFGGYGPEALAITPSAMAAPAKFLAYLFVPPVEWLSVEVMLRGLRFAVAAILVAALASLGLLVAARRHHPAVQAGVAWMIAASLPVVLLTVSLTTTFNDRLFYLPGVGAAMLLGGLAASMSRRLVLALWLLVAAYAVQQHVIVQRWGVAGVATGRIVAGLAEAAGRDTGTPPRYVAAVPDSYRGAYMLRNGLEQALALRGVAASRRVEPLGLYYLDDPVRSPVEARPVSAREVCLQSAGPRDEAVVRFPPEGAPVAVATTLTRDRYGRRPYVLFRFASPADVIAVSPLGQVTPVKGPGGPPARCPAWEEAPVRQPEPR